MSRGPSRLASYRLALTRCLRIFRYRAVRNGGGRGRMLHACLASWKRPLDVQRLSKTTVVVSFVSFPRRRSRQEEERREGLPFSTSTSSSSGEGVRLRLTGSREYHHWSPPGAATGELDKDDALLDSPDSAAPDTATQQENQSEPAARPKAASKSPQAVAMEEFAALERKLAPPRAAPKKTPEQVAMEEFVALERKLAPAAGAGATAGSPSVKRGASKGAPSSSMPRPKVSLESGAIFFREGCLCAQVHVAERRCCVFITIMASCL